jgi:hypothetical protein
VEGLGQELTGEIDRCNPLVLFTQLQYSDMCEGMTFQYGNNCMGQKKICKSVDRAEGGDVSC